MAASAAKAEDAVTIQEIKDLKAHLRMLEKRLDAQAKKTDKVLRHEAAYPPPGAPYSPPMPWDKKFHLNGITLTPGGFLAAEGVWRSRDTGGDFSPQFGSLPAYTTAPAHMNEIRGTARQSRVSLLAEGEINPSTVASAYGEFDFLASGITANSSESNSYQPRIRHLYGALDWNDIGVHLLAGQTWSLATLNNKGITPRNEVTPLTIDAQYVAGFTWARQPQIRLTKNFGDSFWVAASAEMPQTASPCAGGNGTGAAIAGTTVGGTNQAICSQVPSGGSGVLNTAYGYSINHIPDVIAKAAWEPTLGDRKIHIEGYGLYTDLYDYVEYGNVTGAGTTGSPYVVGTSTNNTRYDTTGWGAGGGIIIPVIPKFIDVQGSGIIGRGIGRYGTSGLAAATFNPNGSLDPLPEVQYLGGVIVHATPQLDIYAYGGEEKILSADWTSTTGAGYSNPLANNSGCYIVNGTCAGKVQDAWEATVGFWDKIYEGAFGSIRVGLQYAYIQDDLFAGSANAASVAVGTPRFNDQMVYASFRYYPFDAPPPPAPVISKY